jgi:hypothetical protein
MITIVSIKKYLWANFDAGECTLGESTGPTRAEHSHNNLIAERPKEKRPRCKNGLGANGPGAKRPRENFSVDPKWRQPLPRPVSPCPGPRANWQYIIQYIIGNI